MQPAVNPYAPPQTFAAQLTAGPGAPELYERTRGVGKVAMAMFGAVIVYGVVLKAILWSALMPDTKSLHSGDLVQMRATQTLLDGVDSVLKLAALITFAVFLSRIYTGMQREFGSTKWSSGMAIGAWFIPLANFVLPPMVIGHAWKQKGASPSALIPLWWLGYLALSFVSIAVAVMTSPALHTLVGRVDPDTMNALVWARRVLTVGVYGAWIYLTYELGRRCTTSQA